MTKESTYELQKIDCNCNDCKHLLRLPNVLNQVVETDKESQQWFFDTSKTRKINKAKNNIKNLEKHRRFIWGDVDKKIEGQRQALKDAERLKHGYQGQRNQSQYGQCKKFDKVVTFIPNTCQLETQGCFVHRRTP